MKVKEKIRNRERIEGVSMVISNTLQSLAYDICDNLKKTKYPNGFMTTKQIENVIEVLLSSMEEKNLYIVAQNDLERNRQKDNESIEMWSNRISVTLNKYVENSNVA